MRTHNINGPSQTVHTQVCPSIYVRWHLRNNDQSSKSSPLPQLKPFIDPLSLMRLGAGSRTATYLKLCLIPLCCLQSLLLPTNTCICSKHYSSDVYSQQKWTKPNSPYSSMFIKLRSLTPSKERSRQQIQPLRAAKAFYRLFGLDSSTGLDREQRRT